MKTLSIGEIQSMLTICYRLSFDEAQLIADALTLCAKTHTSYMAQRSAAHLHGMCMILVAQGKIPRKLADALHAKAWALVYGVLPEKRTHRCE